jgi:DNA processing protein
VPADVVSAGPAPYEGKAAPGPATGSPVTTAEEAWPAGFVAGEGDRDALLVLASLPALTPRRLRSLASEVGGARSCLAAVRRGHPLVAPADRELAARLQPAHMLRRLGEVRARMAVPGQEDYPAGVLDLPDPPVALFVRGSSLAALGAGVAVVGARSCSPLGLEVAERFGRGLAAAGMCVLSGGARGIDSAAHRGALAAGGATVAVLGSGIDVWYPTRNSGLLDTIAEQGAVVSEYPPGVPAQPFRFPARNRIVAAMAEAVLVVEGAAGSGSLITADHALDLGRPVFAVPGPVTSALSEAPLALIRDGAGMVRGVEDLLEDIGRLDPLAGPAAAGQRPVGDESVGAVAPGETRSERDASRERGLPAGVSDLERRILETLSGPTLPEVVAAGLGRGLPEVVAAVVGLEVRGLVRTVGGRVERRLGGGRSVGP